MVDGRSLFNHKAPPGGKSDKKNGGKTQGFSRRQREFIARLRFGLLSRGLANEIQKYLKCGSVVALLPENTNTVPQTVMPKKIGTAAAGNYYDETMVATVQ
jgi:hypothetical protein